MAIFQKRLKISKFQLHTFLEIYELQKIQS